ncbi:hypothetical protein RRG08_023567 [Elysia crispata]|uniref:Uncharacterized protein n=1 Tax=Elysia crispata TaxID=231223 RepID=A0AAE0Z8Y8_9GAST|nr:hypothetical protein RRG08_023567 [Elysia crispata]
MDPEGTSQVEDDEVAGPEGEGTCDVKESSQVDGAGDWAADAVENEGAGDVGECSDAEDPGLDSSTTACALKRQMPVHKDPA